MQVRSAPRCLLLLAKWSGIRYSWAISNSGKGDDRELQELMDVGDEDIFSVKVFTVLVLSLSRLRVFDFDTTRLRDWSVTFFGTFLAIRRALRISFAKNFWLFLVVRSVAEFIARFFSFGRTCFRDGIYTGPKNYATVCVCKNQTFGGIPRHSAINGL